MACQLVTIIIEKVNNRLCRWDLGYSCDDVICGTFGYIIVKSKLISIYIKQEID